MSSHPQALALAVALLAVPSARAANGAHELVIDLSPFTPFAVVGEVLGVGTQEGEVTHARLDVRFVSNEAGPWFMGAAFQGFPMGGAIGFSSELQGWSGVGSFDLVVESDALNGPLVVPDGAPFWSWFLSWSGGAPFTPPGGGSGLGPMDGHFEVLKLTLTLAPCPNGDDSRPWTDAGGALPGTLGAPVLSAVGSLCGGEPVALQLSNALPGSASTLVLGLSLLNAPFKGGLMVPRPDVLVVALPIDAQGELLLSTQWPPAIPSGLQFWMQHWIVDAGGPAGLSASNALRGQTP